MMSVGTLSVPVGWRVLFDHMNGGAVDYYAVTDVQADGSLAVVDSNSSGLVGGVGGSVAVDASGTWLDWSVTTPDGSLSLPWSGRGELGSVGSWVVVEDGPVRPADLGVSYADTCLLAMIVGLLCWYFIRVSFHQGGDSF